MFQQESLQSLQDSGAPEYLTDPGTSKSESPYYFGGLKLTFFSSGCLQQQPILFSNRCMQQQVTASSNAARNNPQTLHPLLYPVSSRDIQPDVPLLPVIIPEGVCEDVPEGVWEDTNPAPVVVPEGVLEDTPPGPVFLEVLNRDMPSSRGSSTPSSELSTPSSGSTVQSSR